LLIGFIILQGFHYLDYPVLRPIPEAAVFGFSFALFNMLAFSALIPKSVDNEEKDSGNTRQD